MLRLTRFGQLRGHLGDPTLEPPALGLQRERAGIAGGEGVFDSVDAGGVLAHRRSVEKGADLFENHGRQVRGPLAQVSGQAAGTTWAARTIFSAEGPIFLTGRVQPRKIDS